MEAFMGYLTISTTYTPTLCSPSVSRFLYLALTLAHLLTLSHSLKFFSLTLTRSLDQQKPMASTAGLDSFPYEMLQTVQQMGQPLIVTPQTQRALVGFPVVIHATPSDGTLNMIGGATPVVNGYVEGL